MEYIRVTKENLSKEHICCAISSETDCQVVSKKGWLSERFDDGLVFLRADARGKCFIEYIPAEKAWAPINADGFMYIDCFWVSGQYKGHGYADELLSECIRDSKEKGKKGLCVLSSQKKKMSFLSDPGYLKYKGFITADTAEPFFAFMYLPFDENASAPSFKDSVRKGIPESEGLVIYYADQCPFNAKYIPLLEKTAAENGIPLKTVHITETEQARNAPTPFTSFSLFDNGKLITNEMMNEKKLLAYVGK